MMIEPFRLDPLEENLRKAKTVLDAGIMSDLNVVKATELRCLMPVAVDLLEEAQADLDELMGRSTKEMDVRHA
jgi:hypothetical protein